jgi:hypothetical protein
MTALYLLGIRRGQEEEEEEELLRDPPLTPLAPLLAAVGCGAGGAAMNPCHPWKF